MENCVFCKIIKKELSSKIVYENESTICILSKDMEVYGHTLILPKIHYENLYDIPEKLLTELSNTIKFLAQEYKISINATGINILHASGKDAQQSVPHFHYHLFPRFKNDQLDTWPKLPANKFDPEEIVKKLQIKM